MMKNSRLFTPLAFVALLLAAAASLWGGLGPLGRAQGKDQDNDGIVLKTPAGGFEASNKAKASQIGLPVYPGAKAVSDRDKDSDLAFSLSRQGKPDVHFLVAKFHTQDSVDQVRDYYKKKLGKNVTKFSEKSDDGSISFEMKKAQDRAKFVQVKPNGELTEIELVRIEGMNISDDTKTE